MTQNPLPFLVRNTLVPLLVLGFILLKWQEAEAQSAKSSANTGLYFPPNESSIWEKLPLAELGWDQNALAEMLAWLPTQDTRAFLILKDGKIVVEEYWGSKLTGVGEMDQNSYWYWASAGKTLTAAMVGLAQQEKLLSINDRTQKFLGPGWTSMPAKQERKIRLKHHLTLTTGIDDKVSNLDDFSPSNFKYHSKPGTKWSYHNATYTMLVQVLVNASGMDFQTYFKEKLGNKIGMKGFWQKSGLNTVFYSDARSFARFGLLLLGKGKWDGNQIWSGDYFDEMTESSQNSNPSYGYLTWLNGKSSYLLPELKSPISGSLIPQAPADMYQAMGKNGQILMVIPSQNLVIIRMGGAPGELPVPAFLVRQLWERLSKVMTPTIQGN
ncbi:serine hydrolase domain-containing protein [Algoriphagus boritolerans]|uniref:CubicO group peptidase, beta-lactamase class C family n=1 Tax=Algoriphagus boritolerans DSM 17298 = JCM 18970 TaxID=1120964 RepID=A0A1H5XFK9_9BACT|nr:serine hydrolase domain-containing protein [Algoriphagus boritolerans]SEG10137.1 CubicO group peptidase, beta-lactamase class C family [Algoriphagus boritolerans DSM 17298 = JCM 18970]